MTALLTMVRTNLTTPKHSTITKKKKKTRFQQELKESGLFPARVVNTGMLDLIITSKWI